MLNILISLLMFNVVMLCVILFGINSIPQIESTYLFYVKSFIYMCIFILVGVIVFLGYLILYIKKTFEKYNEYLKILKETDLDNNKALYAKVKQKGNIQGNFFLAILFFKFDHIHLYNSALEELS